MLPDEDGERQGQVLAMLRVEARRYKREMQEIWKQQQLHEQKNSTLPLSSNHSSRVPNDKWRVFDTLSTSTTTGIPILWNCKEKVPVSHLEQLAIMEEGTQTETHPKCEVETETEKWHYDNDLISTMRESETMSLAVNNVAMLNACSRHCNELRSRTSQEATCECLLEAALRVNADVLFTPKPKRDFLEDYVEIPNDNHSRVFQSTDMGIEDHKSTIATSWTENLSKGRNNNEPIQEFRTGLKSLISPILQHNSPCSPISNLHEREARFIQRGDSSNLGGTKATDNTSNSSIEINKSQHISNELDGEGAMVARLATKIKYALEKINEKANTQLANSIFDLPNCTIPSASTCREHWKEKSPKTTPFEDVEEPFEESPLNDKAITSCNSSLLETCHHEKTIFKSFGKKHTNSIPCNDTNIRFENVMATLYANQSTSNERPANYIPKDVSVAPATQRTQHTLEALRRTHFKSCRDHHASHHSNGIEKSVQTNDHQSKIKHKVKKQQFLSNVQKLKNVTESAKRLYTDLVDCAHVELSIPIECPNLVKHEHDNNAKDVSNFAMSNFSPSIELISAQRENVASKDNNEVCGRCFVCQPQLCTNQPLKEPQTNCLDEITIELSDALPTNIMVSQRSCTKERGYNVEVSTPCKLPCKRVSSPNNGHGNTNSQQSALLRDACKPTICTTRLASSANNQQDKKGFNRCLLDHNCDGLRNCCHMPTKEKRSKGSPKRSSHMCLLNPQCNGVQNDCHMPTRAKCARATTFYTNSPKNPNNFLLDTCCDGLQKSCHMPPSTKHSRATTVCINTPKKDSNMCCLDPHCLGSRDSCHMSTYMKSPQASSRPNGNLRIKPNNDTKIFSKNPTSLFQHPAHNSKRMEPIKEKFESNSSEGCFQSASNEHSNNLHDESFGRTFLNARKEESLDRCSKHNNKLPHFFVDELSKVGTATQARDKENLCINHNNVKSSSMKGNETRVGNGGRDDTTRLYYSSSERMDLDNPTANVHRSYQNCSKNGVIKNHSTLKATEDVKKEIGSIEKETKQPTVKHMTSNASTVAEAYTQTLEPHYPSLNNADNTLSTPIGLAKEIEVLIGDQPNKSSLTIKESNCLTSQRRLSKGKKNLLVGQTKLDVAVIAAANAVKKLKHVSLLPLVKQHEETQKAKPQKGLTLQSNLMTNGTIRSGFYDQIYKELEELSLERMQLVRQEHAQFPSESSFFSHQDERRVGFSFRGRKSFDLKNLANTRSELEKATRSVQMQKNQECLKFWHEPIGSCALGNKRQRIVSYSTREHGNKWCLTVRKDKFQSCRKNQDSNQIHSHSVNQAIGKSNNRIDKSSLVNFKTFNSEYSKLKGKFACELGVKNLNDVSSAHLGQVPTYKTNTSSLEKWKLASKEAQIKTTTRRNVLTTRKVRHPPWVERMSKAKNVFSSLIRPLYLDHFRKEPPQKVSIHWKTFQPPRLMCRSSITSKHFGKYNPRGRVFTLNQPNPSRICSKKSNGPNKYDINTGRKIVQLELEPGELRVKSRPSCLTSKSSHEKIIKRIRHPNFVNHGVKPAIVTTLSKSHFKIRGWNSDPLIKSDNPHKTTDIIRYNRNESLDIQIRKRDACCRNKLPTNTSMGRMNIQHVNFARMVLQNPWDEKTRKGVVALHNIDSLGSQVVTNERSTLDHNLCKRTFEKRQSSSIAKMPKMQGKSYRYRGGGRKWIYHEGFLTKMFDSNIERESKDDSFQSLLTPKSILQLEKTSLKLKTAQVLDPHYKFAERGRQEDFLTINQSLAVKGTHNQDVRDAIGKENFGKKNIQSSLISFALENDYHEQKISAFAKENEELQNLDLFKSLDLFNSDGFEDGTIVNHYGLREAKVLLSQKQIEEEVERDESCLNFTDHQNNTKRQEPILIFEESPHSPLQLLDEAFPSSTKNDTLVGMTDCLQEAMFVHAEVHPHRSHSGANCITRQPYMASSNDHENGDLLKNLEFERTLMNIALHTILQSPRGSMIGIEPISFPINKRSVRPIDKGVEAIIHVHDMSQSPLYNSIQSANNSCEQDIIPHVDRASEPYVVSLVDKAIEHEHLSKEQESQTTNAELGIKSIQSFTSSIQEKNSTKVLNMHANHQTIDCPHPWNIVGIEMSDTTSITSSSNLPSATPILMPMFCHQVGMSVLPLALPPAKFSTSSNLKMFPISAINSNFSVEVNQETQATESHIQQNLGKIVEEVHCQVSKLPISNKAILGQCSAWEEKNDCDWKDKIERHSSPSTPSTPLSSPDHNLSLKKAMHLCVNNSQIQEFTTIAGEDPQPLHLEVHQMSKNECQEIHQDLVNELAPPIQMVTEMIIEKIDAHEPLIIASTHDTRLGIRRGTSFAKIKEMEEATLTLLKAATMNTPSTTSSSECSHEISPDVVALMSPGQVNIEGFERGRGGDAFANDSHISQEYLNKLIESQAKSWLSNRQTSIGEVPNSTCFLLPLSEGEIEAGVVSQIGELGQIQNEQDLPWHSVTDLHNEFSEPGELHLDPNASSLQKFATDKVVSNIVLTSPCHKK